MGWINLMGHTLVRMLELAGAPPTRIVIPTPKLQFLGTQPEQFTDLFRRYLSLEPGILILWTLDVCNS